MNARNETTLSLHIDGEWFGIGDCQPHDVVDPATGNLLGALPIATADDHDRPHPESSSISCDDYLATQCSSINHAHFWQNH
jgi:hypothetical protein